MLKSLLQKNWAPAKRWLASASGRFLVEAGFFLGPLFFSFCTLCDVMSWQPAREWADFLESIRASEKSREVFATPAYTGGPHISWFLVPNGNHEMRGSWIPKTVFSVKPQNGSKSFLKSTFWAFFSWNFDFSPIEIAAFSSLLLHAY